MSYQTGPRIVNDGLVFCVDAADANSYPGSGTTWTDLSGGGYNATLVNGPTYSSSNKGAIVFDGTNDTATTTVGSILKNVGTGDFSFSVWFNSTRTDRGDLIVWKSADGTYDIGIILNGSTTGTMVLYYKTPSGGTGYYTSFAYVSSVVNNIHFQRKAGFVEMYLNRVQKHSTSAGGDVTNHPESTIYIASNRGILPFTGSVYAVHIYNKSFTNSEITQNYNALKGRYGL